VRRWQVEGAYEAMERFYDLVLVYGSRDVFDLAEQYRLPAAVARKVRYCGYLCTPEVARHRERIRAQSTNGAGAGTKLVVAMAGGGADAYPMMRALLEALPAVQARERLALVMIVGPFMPSAQRRDLRSRAAGLPVQVRISVPDTLSYIAAADLVIARAGYNTTMEILRASTPALLIPRRGPSAEQRTRVRLFAERGWADTLDPDDVNSRTLADAIAKGLRREGIARARPRPDLGGLSAAVDQLVSLFSTVEEEQQVAPRGA
jgi:predicted glycosyltransferase